MHFIAFRPSTKVEHRLVIASVVDSEHSLICHCINMIVDLEQLIDLTTALSCAFQLFPFASGVLFHLLFYISWLAFKSQCAFLIQEGVWLNWFELLLIREAKERRASAIVSAELFCSCSCLELLSLTATLCLPLNRMSRMAPTFDRLTCSLHTFRCQLLALTAYALRLTLSEVKVKQCCWQRASILQSWSVIRAHSLTPLGWPCFSMPVAHWWQLSGLE